VTERAELGELLAAAREALGHAYCPYSHYRVGAAVRVASGAVHAACNVENASLGLSLCAERAAIAMAVAAGMRAGELTAVAVVAEKGVPAPCGACRQVIAEFAAAGCTVAVQSGDGGVRMWTAAELLPDAFRALP
jgi:homotetrameric cytidine deaminase